MMRKNHDTHRSFLCLSFLFSPLLTLLHSLTFSSPAFTVPSSPPVFSLPSSPLSLPGPQRSSSVRSLRGITTLRRNGWWTLYCCVQKRCRQEMVGRSTIVILLILLSSSFHHPFYIHFSLTSALLSLYCCSRLLFYFMLFHSYPFTHLLWLFSTLR